MGGPVSSSLLRRWFPLPDGYVETGEPLDVLSRQYRKWELASLPLFLVFATPLTFLWWRTLDQIANRVAGGFHDAVFQLRMTWMCWFVPAFLLGVLTATVPLNAFYYCCLSKQRRSAFLRYTNLRHGYDHTAASLPLLLVLAVGVLLIVLPLLHWRAVLAQEEIILYPFFSVSSIHHSYRDVVDLRTAPKCTAPNGKIVDNSDMDHVVEFSDGSTWSTRWIWGELSDDEKRRLIAFLSAKSGKQVRQLPVLEDHW